MARYEIWHADDAGNRLDLLNTTLGFDYVLVDGDVGWLQVNMPYENGRLYSRPRVDQRIQIYRAPDGSSLQMAATGFLRKWSKVTAGGLTAVELGAADPNELVKRRMVAYYDRTDYSIKSDYADDMIKEIAAENLGASATDTARDMTALGVSIQGDLSAGPSIDHAFAHENVLAVFQEIQGISKAAGAETFWRVRADTPETFILETYTGQPGRDRTQGSGVNPLYFGSQFGNIINASLEEIYDSEENYIYAGGPGEGVLQIIQSAGDDTAIAASRWNRREGYEAATGAEYTYQVEDAARAALTQRRPRRLFQAELIPTPLTPFGGFGWGLGDKITISHLGEQIDALIRMVRVKVDGNGMENIQARVEAVL